MDFSAFGWGRVVLLSFLGTLCCIAVAFAIDSYSFETGTWRWGEKPLNNLIIPLILAPPFFFYLLSKQRELAIAHRELMIVASTDSLTSCLNRRAFTAMVDRYLDRIADQKADHHGALLIIDVDHFKNINDVFGHDCGDEALKAIARTIKGTLRDPDFVGRIGGEEFSVFLPGVSPERVGRIAERIRVEVSATELNLNGKSCKLSVSVGGVTFDRNASFSELYRHADQLLYAAKRGGRNRVEIQHASAGSDKQIQIH
ncbi:GGDEF domain-containing protein [Mesorhizobium sp. L-8-10]|uniref:GGDEF domain-containing protein n=1 Tax=unclassified Mesorhizobium TaxID=325217 RepID=UPI00192729DC|nr:MULTISPECIES: GGDEF domain-containing protein [unclassified Mesorhizobium]BCH23518.1 GGDEF domain-containing protein [Mesorhizobium sp. L-8-3]BCH31298.1 GGDEF domain-containing protein [Mesorhizobium sp. L-8-10]